MRTGQSLVLLLAIRQRLQVISVCNYAKLSNELNLSTSFLPFFYAVITFLRGLRDVVQPPLFTHDGRFIQ